jgi:hypothetical protein
MSLLNKYKYKNKNKKNDFIKEKRLICKYCDCQPTRNIITNSIEICSNERHMFIPIESV